MALGDIIPGGQWSDEARSEQEQAELEQAAAEQPLPTFGERLDNSTGPAEEEEASEEEQDDGDDISYFPIL